MTLKKFLYKKKWSNQTLAGFNMITPHFEPPLK